MATMLGQEPCLQLAHVPAAHPGAVPDLQAGKAAKVLQLRPELLSIQLGAPLQQNVPHPPASAEGRQPGTMQTDQRLRVRCTSDF
jgi:hypothetical protein